MTHIFARGIAALFAVGAALPAFAQDAGETPLEESAIVVDAPLLLPSAGLMNDHMHEGGEFMIGLRFDRQNSGGLHQAGADTLSDAETLAAGYKVRGNRMTMDMVMLDLMYAPNDTVTLMVMPHYMWHRMEMIGIDPSVTGTGMSMTGLAYGSTMKHGSDGFGDTLVSASYRLARSASFGAHATLGVWAPTGSVSIRKANGNFEHFMLQPGSGTWDVEPSVTMQGREGALGWGGQAAYKWRTEQANASGYRLGDKARVTGWVSYLTGNSAGITGRVEYAHEGSIVGQYNGPHGVMSPADRPENYGGDVVTASLGLNWLLPVGGARRPQASVEFGVPVYQNLNGVQMPQKWRLSMGLLQTF